MRGFVTDEAVLIGVETRTSAPCRLVRGDDLQSPGAARRLPLRRGGRLRRRHRLLGGGRAQGGRGHRRRAAGRHEARATRYLVRDAEGRELTVPSLHDLHALYDQGFLADDDLVRQERSEDWVRAGDMPALAGRPPPAAAGRAGS